jgi:transketolase
MINIIEEEIFLKYSLKELEKLSNLCKGDILKMTSLANSGHPGGSMSSIDLYLSVFNRANIDPEKPFDENRDRTIIGHGHTSPGVYAALGRMNFFDIDEAITGFRHYSSVFEGHVNRGIPAIEWSTGNLGQGLSVGVGMALAAKLTNKNYRVYVLSSDGESPKGQIAEARRTAKKEKLNNLTVLIDYNDIQISGRARDILYVNIAEEYKISGWNVIEVDGHDFNQLNEALIMAENYKLGPTAIIAHTNIGKNVSFMENKPDYHGKALSAAELEKALKELNLENDFEKYVEARKKLNIIDKKETFNSNISYDIDTGTPIIYDSKTDNRSAFGKAIADLAKVNKDKNVIAAVDCDLSPSVKLDDFKKVSPETFVQIGIQEHNAAALAGAMSSCGVLTFFADFGVFGLDEVFNQQRLNDINKAELKTVLTHCGTDVGEDGKTHHAINYLNLARSFYNTKIIVPGDPNQTDRVIRYVAKTKGNFIVVMGRSKIDIIKKEDGEVYFDENYEYSPEKLDILREGGEVTILTYGSMLDVAFKAVEHLKNENILVNLINVSSPIEADFSSVKPLLENKHIMLFEDHNKESGMINEISKYLLKNSINIKSINNYGIDKYSPSGESKDLLQYFGIDKENIVKKIKEKF